MYCMIHIQNPVCYCKFRHIQAYSRPIQTYSAILWCGMFRTLCNSCIFRTLPYSESWHIKNPRQIYSELCRGIFWHIQNTVLRSHIENSSIFVALPYSEFWHIQDPRHIQNHVYIGTFRNILAYSCTHWHFRVNLHSIVA